MKKTFCLFHVFWSLFISEAVKPSWSAARVKSLSEPDLSSHADPLTSITQIWVTASLSQRWIHLTAARLSAGQLKNSTTWSDICTRFKMLWRFCSVSKSIWRHQIKIPSVLLVVTASRRPAGELVCQGFPAAAEGDSANQNRLNRK